MPRRTKAHDLATPVALYPGSSSTLKKQSRYSRKPWVPGEIPDGGFRPIDVSQPHDATHRDGEFLAVECPKNRGKNADHYGKHNKDEGI